MEDIAKATVAKLIQDVDLCKSVGGSLTPLISESTIPIVAENDGVFRQHGTGTLLTIAQRLFLVTAAHVFRDARKYDLILHVPSKAGDAWLRIFLDFKCLRANSFDDSIDLAISELDDEAKQFLQGYTFVQLLDVNTNQKLEDDIYCVCGFPTKLATIDYSGLSPSVITKFYGVTSLYYGSTALTAYDPRYNILLNAKRSQAVPLVENGGAVPASFCGISGCSIWKTNLAIVGRDAWTPANAKIVAIQTGEYPSAEAIKGTSWKGAATLIHEGWPELRPAMNLILPRR